MTYGYQVSGIEQHGFSAWRGWAQGGHSGFSNPYASLWSILRPFSFRQSGVLPTRYIPEMPTGGRGYGWGDTSFDFAASYAHEPQYDPWRSYRPAAQAGAGAFAGAGGAFAGAYANAGSGRATAAAFAQAGPSHAAAYAAAGTSGYGDSSQGMPLGGKVSSSLYTYTPLYKYEKNLAEDYIFQMGEKYHNVQENVTRTRIQDAPPPPPPEPRVEEQPSPEPWVGGGGGDGGGDGGGGGSPIILDLDGDGKLDVTGKDDSRREVNVAGTVTNAEVTNPDGSIDRVSTHHEESDTLVNWDKKVDFDLTGDGKLDRVEWLKEGAKDGLLVSDFDGDGKITSGRELMRTTGVNGEQGAYKNGWDKLSQLFDKNHDGVVKGDELNGLQVWVDSNGDAKTDNGELKKLADLGIVEIEIPKDGSLKSSYTRQKQIGFVETYSYYSSERVV